MSLQATSNEAVKFSNDMFYYEKRIAEITPEAEFLQDPVKTYNPISVSELKITAASVSITKKKSINSVLWTKLNVWNEIQMKN